MKKYIIIFTIIVLLVLNGACFTKSQKLRLKRIEYKVDQAIEISNKIDFKIERNLARILSKLEVLENINNKNFRIIKKRCGKIEKHLEEIKDLTSAKVVISGIVVNCHNLYIRNGRSMKFKSVGSLNVGDIVGIKNLNGGWAELEQGGFSSIYYLKLSYKIIKQIEGK